MTVITGLKTQAVQLGSNYRLPVHILYWSMPIRLGGDTSFANAIIAKYSSSNDRYTRSVDFVYPKFGEFDAGSVLSELTRQLIQLNRIRIQMNMHNYQIMQRYSLSVSSRCEQLINVLEMQTNAYSGVSHDAVNELAQIYQSLKEQLTTTISSSEISTQLSTVLSTREEDESSLILKILSAASKGNGTRERYVRNLISRMNSFDTDEYRVSRSYQKRSLLEQAESELFTISDRKHGTSMTLWLSEDARRFFWRIQRAPEQIREIFLSVGGFSSLMAFEKVLKTMDTRTYRSFATTLIERVSTSFYESAKPRGNGNFGEEYGDEEWLRLYHKMENSDTSSITGSYGNETLDEKAGSDDLRKADGFSELDSMIDSGFFSESKYDSLSVIEDISDEEWNWFRSELIHTDREEILKHQVPELYRALTEGQIGSESKSVTEKEITKISEKNIDIGTLVTDAVSREDIISVLRTIDRETFHTVVQPILERMTESVSETELHENSFEQSTETISHRNSNTAEIILAAFADRNDSKHAAEVHENYDRMRGADGLPGKDGLQGDSGLSVFTYESQRLLESITTEDWKWFGSELVRIDREEVLKEETPDLYRALTGIELVPAKTSIQSPENNGLDTSAINGDVSSREDTVSILQSMDQKTFNTVVRPILERMTESVSEPGSSTNTIEQSVDTVNLHSSNTAATILAAFGDRKDIYLENITEEEWNQFSTELVRIDREEVLKEEAPDLYRALTGIELVPARMSIQSPEDNGLDTSAINGDVSSHEDTVSILRSMDQKTFNTVVRPILERMTESVSEPGTSVHNIDQPADTVNLHSPNTAATILAAFGDRKDIYLKNITEEEWNQFSTELLRIDREEVLKEEAPDLYRALTGIELVPARTSVQSPDSAGLDTSAINGDVSSHEDTMSILRSMDQKTFNTVVRPILERMTESVSEPGPSVNTIEQSAETIKLRSSNTAETILAAFGDRKDVYLENITDEEWNQFSTELVRIDREEVLKEEAPDLYRVLTGIELVPARTSIQVREGNELDTNSISGNVSSREDTVNILRSMDQKTFNTVVRPILERMTETVSEPGSSVNTIEQSADTVNLHSTNTAETILAAFGDRKDIYLENITEEEWNQFSTELVRIDREEVLKDEAPELYRALTGIELVPARTSVQSQDVKGLDTSAINRDVSSREDTVSILRSMDQKTFNTVVRPILERMTESVSVNEQSIDNRDEILTTEQTLRYNTVETILHAFDEINSGYRTDLLTGQQILDTEDSDRLLSAPEEVWELFSSEMIFADRNGELQTQVPELYQALVEVRNNAGNTENEAAGRYGQSAAARRSTSHVRIENIINSMDNETYNNVVLPILNDIKDTYISEFRENDAYSNEELDTTKLSSRQLTMEHVFRVLTKKTAGNTKEDSFSEYLVQFFEQHSDEDWEIFRSELVHADHEGELKKQFPELYQAFSEEQLSVRNRELDGDTTIKSEEIGEQGGSFTSGREYDDKERSREILHEKELMFKILHEDRGSMRILRTLIIEAIRNIAVLRENQKEFITLSESVMNLTSEQWNTFKQDVRVLRQEDTDIRQLIPETVFREAISKTQYRTLEEDVHKTEKYLAQQEALQTGIRMSAEKMELLRILQEETERRDTVFTDVGRKLFMNTVLRNTDVGSMLRPSLREMSSEGRERWRSFVTELIHVEKSAPQNGANAGTGYFGKLADQYGLSFKNGASTTNSASLRENAVQIMEQRRQERILDSETIIMRQREAERERITNTERQVYRLLASDAEVLFPENMREVPAQLGVDMTVQRMTPSPDTVSQNSSIQKKSTIRTENSHDIEFETVSHTISEKSDKELRRVSDVLERHERELSGLLKAQRVEDERDVSREVMRKINDRMRMERLRGGF